MKTEYVRFLDSKDTGALIGVRAATLRHAICTKGSYFGLIPRKAPNGRLRWPEQDVIRFLAGDVPQAERAA